MTRDHYRQACEHAKCAHDDLQRLLTPRVVAGLSNRQLAVLHDAKRLLDTLVFDFETELLRH